MPDKELRTLELNISSKERFAIDGDHNKIVEIDTHDLNVLKRLKEALKKMDSIQKEWNALSNTTINEEEVTVEEMSAYSDKFDTLEQSMRELIDSVFDCENLCTTILGKSSVFSPINGVMKYEQIISTFCNLYEDSIKAEADKLNKRKVEERTAKYTHKK